QGFDYFCNCSSNNYNALQLKAEKRFAQGYSFLVHYTWSKAMNFDADYFTHDARLNYGPTDTDRTHAFIFTNLWEVPVGKGKRFLSDTPRAVDMVIGGWQINQSTSVLSGLPYSLSYQNCGDDRDTGPCRVNLVGSTGISGQGDSDSTGRKLWFAAAPAT